MKRFITANPMVTTSVAGFVIASLGDISCQSGFEGRNFNELDWKRTADMGSIRAFVMAPFLSWYFPRLAAAVPGTSAPAIVRRIVADQTFGSPIAICMTFIASSALLGDISSAPERIRQQLWPTWLNSIGYWPFAHILTFKFVPTRYQAHFANFLSVYWNGVLSYRANISLKPLDSSNHEEYKNAAASTSE